MVVVLLAAVGASLIAIGQATPTTSGTPPSVERAEDAPNQLETCRQGLLDPKARPDERRRWAELLLSFDTPLSNSMVNELLAGPPRPEVQIPLLRAMAERPIDQRRSAPWTAVETLNHLLGAESEEVRAGAARVLSDFDDPRVGEALFEIARYEGEAMTRRLAAVEALLPNAHRRDIVGHLIQLLQLRCGELAGRIVPVLEAVAGRNWGNDPGAWQAWWEEQHDFVSDEAWLTGQLRRYRDRSRKLEAELQSQRAEIERNQNDVLNRMREFAREAIKPLPPEQRDARLVEWLEDPLPAVKLAALGIVKARIADEGKRPEGEVLASLLRLLRHDSPALRREALLIAQNLSDLEVVEAVLARLADEKELPIRHSVFQALGKLGSVTAIPALLREIASSASTADCVREAALALGALAVRAESKDFLHDSATVLLDRYHTSLTGTVSLRAALLSAMAGIGDPEFAKEFQEAVECEEVGVLEAALRGLRAVGDGSQSARCRALTSHVDARVRVAAIEAVAALSKDEADIESLIVRLNPAIETNELAREAAWRGLKVSLAKRPMSERMRVIDQLREMPEAAIRYMEEQIASLGASGNNHQELDALRDRLSASLLAMGRFGEAVPHLRELYALRASRGDPSASAVGLRWLQAVMRSPAPSGLADLVARLSETSADSAGRTEIIRTVKESCEAPAVASDLECSRRLLNELRVVSAENLGDEWVRFLQKFSSQVEAREREATPKPLP